MGTTRAAGLERSCGPGRTDWLRNALPQPGVQRLEAYFSGHAYDPHRHDTYAIGYTISGVQSFDYRGARADSTHGCVITLHPDECHDGRAGAPGGFHYRMLYVEPRLIRDALGDRAHTLPFVPRAVLHDHQLLQALQLALDDFTRPLESLELDHALLGIAEALLTHDPSARHRGNSTYGAVAVERARQYLDAHVARVVTSEELETLTGCDRYTLARQFRAQLGTSPYRYLTMRRLDHARTRLQAGEPLAQVAACSGFADQSHMTRQFHRAYGLPPGRWRTLSATTMRE
jgi:AraC-like DNA-binding protein